jgi:hypothetical protein
MELLSLTNGPFAITVMSVPESALDGAPYEVIRGSNGSRIVAIGEPGANALLNLNKHFPQDDVWRMISTFAVGVVEDDRISA